MSKYMPQLEQPLASGRGAGGKSLTDGERKRDKRSMRLAIELPLW